MPQVRNADLEAVPLEIDAGDGIRRPTKMPIAILRRICGIVTAFAAAPVVMPLSVSSEISTPGRSWPSSGPGNSSLNTCESKAMAGEQQALSSGNSATATRAGCLIALGGIVEKGAIVAEAEGGGTVETAGPEPDTARVVGYGGLRRRRWLPLSGRR